MTGLAPTGPSFCRLYDRCPHAMPICVEQAPPLYRTAPDRGTACYLYREAPTITAAELAMVVGGPDGSVAATEGLARVAATAKADRRRLGRTLRIAEPGERHAGGGALTPMLRCDDQGP